MMRAPAFWQQDGLLPRLLAPAGALYAAATARRVAAPGWRAPVPVLCCGNAGVGGAGKTTVALDLGIRLLHRGARPAFLTRGYGGRANTPVRVAPDSPAAAVGDEALLLAAVAPCWTGPDRAATARLAIADHASVLVMDDGLQNPGLVKDLSLLVIDGVTGFGNGRVLPAGPLRETVAAAAARCQAAILIGDDLAAAAAALPPGLPILRARLQSDVPQLQGRRVLAFAGIGRPAKFFDTLRQAGVAVADTASFPDHHPFTAAELDRLATRAARQGLALVTTPKDAVRIPAAFRGQVATAPVRLHWDDPAGIEALLGSIL